MTTTLRIPKTEITGLYGAMVKAFTRRMFGEVPEPAEVMWHNPAVMKTLTGFGQKADRRWKACDENLKTYAHMAVSAQVGCSFCLDLGYFMAHDKGLDEAKASEVPRWRESDVFTPLERDVMEYAEAMSQASTAVTDELSDRLLDALGPAALVELAAWIGFSNATARMNTALGISSQGFSEVCELPLARPTSHTAA